ncbi:DapH/DapD/GlmU-related protein [uncultured Alistipes sp.]|uniref:DapH/DapD/GlmU-related protein n=1 Tax=uncultured Alistipes sp. TaxID=538949 RepID=UPI002803BFC6|nr:DapH/DapD/GlmU-related protein [uncultured Alistipes sp.]
MTLEEFLAHVAARRPLATPEIGAFMDEMSDRARRITCRINGSYHSQEELRGLMGELFGRPVDATFRLFPPFYTDFGQNIHIGRNVFINAGCQFQDHGGVTLGDGTLVGHNVVFATLNHLLDPARRAEMIPAPIVVGRNVWIGSNATILQGVTIGDGAVVAAGAVVTHDVEPRTIVGGVPARMIRRIELPEDR